MIKIPLGYDDPEKEEGEIITAAIAFSNPEQNKAHFEILRQLKLTQVKSILNLKLNMSQIHSAYLSELDWQKRGYPGLTTSTLYWYNDHFPLFKEETNYFTPNPELIAPIEYSLIIKEDKHTHFFIPSGKFVPNIKHSFISWVQLVSMISSYDGDLHIQFGSGKRLEEPYNTWKKKAQEFREEMYWNLAAPDYHPDYYGPYPGRVKVILDLHLDIALTGLGFPLFEAIAEFEPSEKRTLEQVIA